jgi:hypothetical protein
MLAADDARFALLDRTLDGLDLSAEAKTEIKRTVAGLARFFDDNHIELAAALAALAYSLGDALAQLPADRRGPVSECCERLQRRTMTCCANLPVAAEPIDVRALDAAFDEANIDKAVASRLLIWFEIIGVPLADQIPALIQCLAKRCLMLHPDERPGLIADIMKMLCIEAACPPPH